MMRCCQDAGIEVLQAFDLKQTRELFLANQDIDGILWDGSLPDGESLELIKEVVSMGYKGPMVANSGNPFLAQKQMKCGCTV